MPGRRRRRRRSGHDDQGPLVSPAGIGDRTGSGRQEKASRLSPLPEGVFSRWLYWNASSVGVHVLVACVCRQQALTTGPGGAGKKRLVDSYHSRRTSAPAGGPAASIDGQRLLGWYSRAEEPGGPRYSVAPCDQGEWGPSRAAGSPEGTVLVFWL
ncbi:hypothetical protein MRX96_046373 [Rhipicephalus microplus]